MKAMQAKAQATTQATAPAGADVASQATTPKVTVYTDAGTQVLQIPTSRDEMTALMTRRRQLSDQLKNVSDRRNDIIEQLRVAPNAAQPGLQAQLSVLDARVVQLENDLATIGRELAAASPQLMAMTEEPSNSSDNGSFEDGVGAGVAGTLGAAAVLFFFARRWWKKSTRGLAQPLKLNADSQRLQRLETGMEAMAIEIERISEGQRFVTRLLSESHAGAVPTQSSGQGTVLESDPRTGGEPFPANERG